MSDPNLYPPNLEFPPASFDPAAAAAADRKPLPLFDGHPAGVMPPTLLQTASQRREEAKARRRVPASQRKRTKLSCDACKARRCKCLRVNSSPGTDDVHDEDSLAPCKNCLGAGIECVTTLPRKQRIYGSVENLDRRYRALDALVSGLFPQLGTNATADELTSFGRQNGLAMPDIGYRQPERSQTPSTISSLVTPASPPTAEYRIGDDHLDPDLGSNNFFKDTDGRSQYIGPSGSLATFARMRDLIARRLQASTDPDANRRGQHMTAKSVTDAIARSFDRASEHPAGAAHPTPIHLALQEELPHEGFQKKYGTTSGTNNSKCWVPVSSIKLPNKDVADACVKSFFDHVHPDFMLIHQPEFQKHYDDLWKSSSRRPSIQPNVTQIQKGTHVSVGWLCCLYMMFILGSRALPQGPGSLDFQRSYFETVKELPSMLAGATLLNVSALMLLSLYTHNINDRAGSWAYLGAACRLAISLGMHRECNDEVTVNAVVREVRKRAWWSLYDFEQHLCCSLGRPSAIDDGEVNVGIPDESVTNCPHSLPPQYMEYCAQMARLMGTIRREIHDPNSTTTSVLPRAIKLLRPLISWITNIPPEFRPTQAPQTKEARGRWRRIMLLHIRYQKTLTLLTRRFLLKEVELADQKNALGEDAFATTQLGKICVTSSVRCVRLLVDLWRAGSFNGVTWLDTYYAYLASIQICLRLLVPFDHGKGAAAEGWNPQYPPVVEGSHHGGGGGSSSSARVPPVVVVMPSTALELELQSLISQAHLVEDHTAAELTDAVRQVNDMLKTVEMCGFSAKCNMLAAEFGKAIGVVDGLPLSTLFGGQMGHGMEKVEANLKTERSSIPPPLHQQQHMAIGMLSLESQRFFHGVSIPARPVVIQPQQLQQFQQQGHGQAGMPALPRMANTMPSDELDYNYAGVLNANNAAAVPATQPPGVQWDLVLVPDQWQGPQDMLTDMAAPITWSWPNEGDIPYGSIDPPQQCSHAG
jgi:proline utilization trans-activator